MANTNDSHFTPKVRRQSYEQIIAILNMNGVAIDDKSQAFMQPLLDGSITLEEHSMMLNSILQRLGDE